MYVGGYIDAVWGWGARFYGIHSNQHSTVNMFIIMDFCMKYLAQVISFVSWITGFFISVIARISPIIDDSISLLAGIIGLFGGIVWVTILIKKNKLVKRELDRSEIELDNEILDSKIKNIQLNMLMKSQIKKK